jgi:hypothetical protein
MAQRVVRSCDPEQSVVSSAVCDFVGRPGRCARASNSWKVPCSVSLAWAAPPLFSGHRVLVPSFSRYAVRSVRHLDDGGNLRIMGNCCRDFRAPRRARGSGGGHACGIVGVVSNLFWLEGAVPGASGREGIVAIAESGCRCATDPHWIKRLHARARKSMLECSTTLHPLLRRNASPPQWALDALGVCV